MAKGVEKDFSDIQKKNRQEASPNKQQIYYYTGLMALVVLGYLLVASGLGIFFSAFISPVHPLVTGMLIFVIFLVINPLQAKMKDWVDAAFLKKRQAAREIVDSLNRNMLRATRTSEILSALDNSVREAYSPVSLHFFLLDPAGDCYVPASEKGGKKTSDLRFSAKGNHKEFFNGFKRALPLDRIHKQKALPPDDLARLALLNAQWLVPLIGRSGLTGWAAIGIRGDNTRYTAGDLELMEELGAIAGEALEKTGNLTAMDNRVREMNLLTRIAQGVNITLSQDDMLELVYTQTTQMIPADDFEVYLVDNQLQSIRGEFIVEENERRTERERQPVVGSQPLELEVLHQRRMLVTADYALECRQRGILSKEDANAWMGVPMNAGADTIGVICLGRRKSGDVFTQEQAALLQAIADQTAGAITKLSLLKETERRAKQLSTLNEMTRQLTSTLEQEPLLENILQSATDMLDCEAGSLLLVDTQTDELVFRVTVGPVAGNLLNHRMPSGAGLVGKAAKMKMPVVENNVHQSPDWFKKADQMTGFITKSALVVPLLVKETAIGVIEVVNKKDGSLFSQDDQNLLSAFAAQAAVALENARLFTMTDQALTERVEELSVMQQIDRELNTSLDTTKAMQISLEWAMRQSSASAGLIGALEDSHLKIIASQGYTAELGQFPNGLIPLTSPQYQQAIAEGTPRLVIQSGEEKQFLLEQTPSQVVIPIRRETGAIGMMILEGLKVDPPLADTMDFLQRLADHASIAISNAQLYAAVQSANVAKSEFVSFVSHELKNPMTSIKGYTELLAAGAVGQVNEAQANFLGTIRANIERMNILVSDLNDMSKIEAGRLRLEYKSFTTLEVVEEVVRSTRKQVEEKAQHLSHSILGDLPNIWADRTRVAQVLVNLVSNAIKYTLQGGEIKISAQCCANQWDPDGAPQVIHVSVQDNGIGISEEDQKKIFQKFFRSEDPRTREVPGTGLGLNITRSLVEMQGGRIWFESEYRKGTTFHFTVPVVS